MKFRFLFSLTVLIGFQTFSQYQSWIGMDLSYKALKKVGLDIGVQHRLNGMNNWNKSLFSSAVSINVANGFKPFVSFRLGIYPNKYSALNLKENSQSTRFSLGIESNIMEWIDEKSRLKIGITVQQQWNSYTFNRSSSNTKTELGIKYDIQDFPLSPYFSFNHYYNWKRDIIYTEDEVIISSGTQAFRYFLGFDIELPKEQIIQICIGKRDNYLSGSQYWIGSLKYKLTIK